MSKKELVEIRLEVLRKLKTLFRPPDYIYENMVKKAKDIDYDYRTRIRPKTPEPEIESSVSVDVYEYELSTDDQYFLMITSTEQHKKEEEAGGKWAYIIGLMRKEYTEEEINEINSWTETTLIQFIENFCKGKTAIKEKKITNRPLIAKLVKFLYDNNFTIDNVYNKYKNYIDVNIEVEVNNIATELIDDDMSNISPVAIVSADNVGDMDSPRIIAEREIRNTFNQEEITYILRWGDNLQSIFIEIKSGIFDDDKIDDNIKLKDIQDAKYFYDLFERLINVLFIKKLIDKKIVNQYIGDEPIDEPVDTAGLVIDETDDEKEETTDEEQEDKDKEDAKKKIMNMINRYGEDKVFKLYKNIGFSNYQLEDFMIIANFIRKGYELSQISVNYTSEGETLYNELVEIINNMDLPEIEDDEEDSSSDVSSDENSD